MSATDDVFGQRPLRPEHPDFWRMSELFLAGDGAIDEAAGEDAKEEVWRRRTTDVVDISSVTYMAAMRASRLLGPPTPETIMLHSQVSALFIDAFVAGALFERRGGHQE